MKRITLLILFTFLMMSCARTEATEAGVIQTGFVVGTISKIEKEKCESWICDNHEVWSIEVIPVNIITRDTDMFGSRISTTEKIRLIIRDESLAKEVEDSMLHNRNVRIKYQISPSSLSPYTGTVVKINELSSTTTHAPVDNTQPTNAETIKNSNEAVGAVDKEVMDLIVKQQELLEKQNTLIVKQGELLEEQQTRLEKLSL